MGEQSRQGIYSFIRRKMCTIIARTDNFRTTKVDWACDFAVNNFLLRYADFLFTHSASESSSFAYVKSSRKALADLDEINFHRRRLDQFRTHTYISLEN